MCETPFMPGSTTLALTCPETVHQRPCMAREIETWGPIYKISYDYRQFIVRPTYDSDFKRAEISLRNIVS